jgi:hypothetical protein
VTRIRAGPESVPDWSRLDDRLHDLRDTVDRAPELHGAPVGSVSDRLKHDLDQAGSLEHGDGRRSCQSLARFAADVQASTAPAGLVTAADAAAWIAEATDLGSAAGC